MNALVTGGGGFIGGRLARALQAAGHAVTTYQRGDYPELAASGIRTVRGDIADERRLTEAVTGQDIVFHVAALAGAWGRWEDFHRSNVLGTRSVIAACRHQQVKRLVFTSSPSVVFHGQDMRGADETVPYPAHHEAAYPATKAEAERAVLAANDDQLATVALRPHLVWGPGDSHLLPRLLKAHREGRLRRIGDGTNLVDATYIDNAVQAHLAAAERLAPGAPCAGKAYFIANGEPLPAWELIDRLLIAAGAGRVRGSVPAFLAVGAGTVLESVYRTLALPGEPPMTRWVARELATSHYFDLAAARRDLEYLPRVSTDEGLRRLTDWWASHGAASARRVASP
ncbi:MAG: NAD-dependent epimerase/dehydratase family protein [Candidatus Sericytochromatia bacterium]|nr:NAD-dependent epimerase/dehydratase family protein [Candidatus Sericytochromatia bacterium]